MRDQTHISRRAAATFPFAALVGSASPTLPALASPNADDTLLDLGERWHAAGAALHQHDLAHSVLSDDSHAAQQAFEAIGDRLFAKEQALFDEIMASPARTLQGLAVKGQALARAFDVMEPGAGPIEAALARDTGDMEVRSALKLALDVLRLARAKS